MSLEAKIEALTASVDRLTALLANGGAPIAAAPAATPAAQPATPAPAAQPAPASAPAPAPVPQAQPAAGVVEYDAVKRAVIDLASKKGRDAAVTVLKTFNVEKATDLKPDQYPAAIDALQKAAA